MLFKFLFTFGVFAAPIVSKAAESQDVKCTIDADCVVVSVACENYTPAAVAKKARKRHEAAMREKCKGQKGPKTSMALGGPATAICAEQQCKLKTQE